MVLRYCIIVSFNNNNSSCEGSVYTDNQWLTASYNTVVIILDMSSYLTSKYEILIDHIYSANNVFIYL